MDKMVRKEKADKIEKCMGDLSGSALDVSELLSRDFEKV